MSLLDSLKKSLGITKEPPLTDSETRLLTQLQANRKTALEQVLPDEMRTEFMTSVYSDRHLESIVKEIYRYELIGDNADLRRTLLENAIRLSLSIKRFGRNLILYHAIDPGTVAQIMLRDVNF